jgi:hypothetical protein
VCLPLEMRKRACLVLSWEPERLLYARCRNTRLGKESLYQNRVGEVRCGLAVHAQTPRYVVSLQTLHRYISCIFTNSPQTPSFLNLLPIVVPVVVPVVGQTQVSSCHVGVTR